MNQQSTHVQEIQTIFLKCLHQIAPEIAVETIQPEAVLREVYEIDSVDFLRLVVLLHDAFKIDIPENDYPSLATLASSVDYFQKKIT